MEEELERDRRLDEDNNNGGMRIVWVVLGLFWKQN
jgi:hypothetical protein